MADNRVSLCRLKLQPSPCQIGRIRLEVTCANVQQVKVMELTGVEPVSALGISTPLIHRLSFSDPRSGNRSLSRTVGCSGKVLPSHRPEAVS